MVSIGKIWSKKKIWRRLKRNFILFNLFTIFSSFLLLCIFFPLLSNLVVLFAFSESRRVFSENLIAESFIVPQSLRSGRTSNINPLTILNSFFSSRESFSRNTWNYFSPYSSLVNNSSNGFEIGASKDFLERWVEKGSSKRDSLLVKEINKSFSNSSDYLSSAVTKGDFFFDRLPAFRKYITWLRMLNTSEIVSILKGESSQLFDFLRKDINHCVTDSDFALLADNFSSLLLKITSLIASTQFHKNEGNLLDYFVHALNFFPRFSTFQCSLGDLISQNLFFNEKTNEPDFNFQNFTFQFFFILKQGGVNVFLTLLFLIESLFILFLSFDSSSSRFILPSSARYFSFSFSDLIERLSDSRFVNAFFKYFLLLDSFRLIKINFLGSVVSLASLIKSLFYSRIVPAVNYLSKAIESTSKLFFSFMDQVVNFTVLPKITLSFISGYDYDILRNDKKNLVYQLEKLLKKIGRFKNNDRFFKDFFVFFAERKIGTNGFSWLERFLNLLIVDNVYVSNLLFFESFSEIRNNNLKPAQGILTFFDRSFFLWKLNKLFKFYKVESLRIEKRIKTGSFIIRTANNRMVKGRIYFWDLEERYVKKIIYSFSDDYIFTRVYSINLEPDRRIKIFIESLTRFKT